MKVFLSYAFDDEQIMTELKKELEGHGIDIYVAVHDVNPGKYLDKKIELAIQGCDALVVIITKRSETSASVNQEVGFAKAKKIQIIPIVERGTTEGVLLRGPEPIDLDIKRIPEISKEIADYLFKKPGSNAAPAKSSSETEETTRITSKTKHMVAKAKWIRQKFSTVWGDLEGYAIVCPTCDNEEPRALRESSSEDFRIVDRDNRFCTKCDTEFSNYDDLIGQIEYYVKYEKRRTNCGAIVNRESDKHCGKCGQEVGKFFED